MVDDVLINKAATIERCLMRAREEYDKSPATFASDHTRQDAAILNVQRACEAALDMGQHLIRRERLGIPQSSRDVFTLLAQAGWIEAVTPTAKALLREAAAREHRSASNMIEHLILEYCEKNNIVVGVTNPITETGKTTS